MKVPSSAAATSLQSCTLCARNGLGVVPEGGQWSQQIRVDRGGGCLFVSGKERYRSVQRGVGDVLEIAVARTHVIIPGSTYLIRM